MFVSFTTICHFFVSLFPSYLPQIISPIPNNRHMFQLRSLFSNYSAPICNNYLNCELFLSSSCSQIISPFPSLLICSESIAPQLFPRLFTCSSNHLPCSEPFATCSQIFVPNSAHLVLQDYPMCSQIFSSVPGKNTPACLHKICSKSLLLGTFSYHLPFFAPLSSHLLAPKSPPDRGSPLWNTCRRGRGGGGGWVETPEDL